MAEPAATQERRRYGRSAPATETVLYEAVRSELSTFLEGIEESGSKPLPRYVLQALGKYRRCGDFAHGFCRWTCERCQHDLLVAFSCGVRSICPSCGVRRMDEVGAELVDRILPDVPYRQYVLSVPWELRMPCASDARVLSALVRCLWRSVHRELLSLAAIADAETGTVTFVQRFGGSLNLHPHLHLLAPQGVFVKDGSAVRFVPIDPKAIDVMAVVGRVRKSMLRWLRRHGFMKQPASTQCPEPDALHSCQQLGIQYGQLVSLPLPTDARQSTEDDGRRFEARRRRYHARTEDGFDLDASVAIAQGDDEGRERLVRYGARPAVVLERLQKLPDGRFSYTTKYARNGRSHRIMTGCELMARLCALVPPPRYPLLRYSGVFSAGHTWRSLVIPKPPAPRSPCRRARPSTVPPTTAPEQAPPEPEPAELVDLGSREPIELRSSLRSPFVLSDKHLRRLLDGMLLMKRSTADWSMLLRRSHGLDVLDCPKCHGRLRLRGALTDKTQVRRFLEHLGRPSESPPLAPARDPTFDFVA